MSGGNKKKNKYVNVLSQEGKERLTVRLPGRSSCECQASKHTLVGNCRKCGRIVCSQEGSGPCFFCGQLVCSREERQLIESGTREGIELKEKLLARPIDKENVQISSGLTSEGSLNDIAQAIAFKNKLIEFDRTSAQRTRVIDDASDYFDSNDKWLSKNQRAKLEKLQSQIAAKKNNNDRKITIDFAGRRVYNEVQSKDFDRLLNEAQAVQEDENYQLESERIPIAPLPNWDDDDNDDLINRNLPGSIQAPQWVEQKSNTSNMISQMTIEDRDRQRLRIQDKELMQMTDDGMCLSMHQPWASLLVRGIKMHEGRTWYTAHRGRLWIHAAAHEPDSDVITEMEIFYKSRCSNDEDERRLDFPTEYPTSVLLGCVDVIDCLDRQAYSEQYPDGESDSDYVLICENPQELFFKIPMRGKHKIYKMENQAHQAAKKILLRKNLIE